MKKRVFSTIVCLVLTMVMLIPNQVTALQAVEKKSITNYVTVSHGTLENVLLCSSYEDFKSQIEMGASPYYVPASGKSYFDTSFNITLNENGYFFIRGTGYSQYSYGHMNVYRDQSLTTCVSSCKFYNTFYDGIIPVEAGTYYLDLYHLKSFYVGFVPASSSCELKAREQKNKSVYLDITTLDKKAKVSAVALDVSKSAAYCWENWFKGEYECTVKDNTATILLPEPGKYTIMVNVEERDSTDAFLSQNHFVYQIDTKELLADAKKMETPISILAGTNAIIGQAKPNATIYATVNGTDYSAKADANGTYRLKVGKLKKKKSIKMWQVENGKTTAEGTFKVVSKY